MEMNGIPSATQADRAVYAASAPVRVFQPDVDSLLAPLDSVERILGHALAAYGDSLLRLMAVVSPYNQSVCFHRGGGYVFIALNHYLGRDYAGYAGRFPAYMLHRKDLRRLPSDVMETVMASVSPEQIRPGATFLNRMLYSGALAYCVLQTMPEGTPESVVLGLTDSQWQWCVDNEERLWRSLIERQLLYSSDPAVADRLLRPAPASPLLGPSAPGQAACFIGLRVVQAFAGKYSGKATPGYNHNTTRVMANNDNNRQFSRNKPTHKPLFDTGGRIPPHDKDVEEAVLGALMLEKDAYPTVCDIIKPETFYEPVNQKIYEAIQTLGAAQSPIDMLTVTEQLRANGTIN